MKFLFLAAICCSFCTRYTVLSGDSCDTISVVPNANNPNTKFKNITQAQFEEFNQANCGQNFPPQPGNVVCISEGGLPPTPVKLDNGYCSSYRVAPGDSCDSIASNDTFQITKDQIQNFNQKVCGQTFPVVDSIICLSDGELPKNSGQMNGVAINIILALSLVVFG